MGMGATSKNCPEGHDVALPASWYSLPRLGAWSFKGWSGFESSLHIHILESEEEWSHGFRITWPTYQSQQIGLGVEGQGLASVRGLWLLLLLLPLALEKLAIDRLPSLGFRANTGFLLGHFYHTQLLLLEYCNCSGITVEYLWCVTKQGRIDQCSLY